jgi:beta-lactam-binding protein with PASTA domain
VESDSLVSVTVSSGPKEKFATVPDVPDRSIEKAERVLSNAEPVAAGSQTEEKQRVSSEESSSGQTVRRPATPPSFRPRLLVGSGILLVLVVVVLIVALVNSPPSGSKATSVPDLRGKALSEAAKEAGSTRLELRM